MKTITVYTAKEFKDWLKKYHNKESRVAVVLYKRHTEEKAPTHRELINEAICFGWIDTTIKRLDEDRFIRHFAHRTKNSTWSDNTLSYAKQLVQEKKMQPEGLKFYKLGLAKPTHDHGIPKNPSMPEELKNALKLKKNAKARKIFELFPPSTRKMLYRWILSGKQAKTRKVRVQKIIDGAKVGNRNIILNKDL